MTTETATNGTHHAKTDGPAVKKTAKRRTAARGTRHTSNNRFATALSHGDIATATQGISQQLMEMKEKGAQTAETIEKGIVRNPKSSVVLAFGVGYVLARLGRWL